MGLEFLNQHGARRMREYDPQPLLLDDGLTQTEPQEEILWKYEVPADDWQPLDVASPDGLRDWPLRPLRFVDGRDRGRTVTTIYTRDKHPVPVRISEIGAVALRDVEGSLRREASVIIERIITFIIDPFAWDEIESFAIALRKIGKHGFRLLPSPAPEGGLSYDYERMRKTTQNSSNTEMSRLEKRVLAFDSRVPTIVDGRLEPRLGAFDQMRDPVAGLIKTHRENYLHPRGWQVFYSLEPAQRTPALLLQGKHLNVVTWYVRLDGAGGEMPNYGVVRLEITQSFFENALGRDWNYINRLSRLICDYRCRDESYDRAAISIHPIKRAEDSLGALLTDGEVLTNRFYHLTNL